MAAKILFVTIVLILQPFLLKWSNEQTESSGLHESGNECVEEAIRPEDTSTPNRVLALVTREEQRAYIKIECAGGASPAEVVRRLNRILGTERALSESWIMRLCREFNNGRRTGIECLQRSGRPRTATGDENIEQMIAIIAQTDGMTAEEISLHLGVSESSVLRMLHQVGYQYVRSRWVPHELSEGQRNTRVELARSYLQRYEQDNSLLDRIIAVDETWLPSYMPLTDSRARSWVPPGETPPPQVRENHPDFKVGAVVAFWKRQVLTVMILESDQTMSGDRFLEFVKDYLLPAIRKERRTLTRPAILMDNARYHFASQVKEFFRSRRSWEILKQNPYSPDQNPCDSHGFRQLKSSLRGRRFAIPEGLLAEFSDAVDRVNAQKNFAGIDELPRTWQAIIDQNGNYVH